MLPNFDLFLVLIGIWTLSTVFHCAPVLKEVSTYLSTYIPVYEWLTAWTIKQLIFATFSLKCLWISIQAKWFSQNIYVLQRESSHFFYLNRLSPHLFMGVTVVGEKRRWPNGYEKSFSSCSIFHGSDNENFFHQKK